MYWLKPVKIKQITCKAVFFAQLFAALMFHLQSIAQTSTRSAEMFRKVVEEKDVNRAALQARQALRTARLEPDHATEIKCLHYIAQFHFGKGAFDSTKFFEEKALSVALKYRVTTLSGDVYAMLGMTDQRMGKFETAIRSYQQAISIYRSRGYDLSVAVAYLNIGICEKQRANYREAITYYLSACKLFEAAKDSGYLATAYNSVALCFVSLQDYPKAISYNKTTLGIRNMLGDKNAIAQSLNNLGYAYNEAGQPDSALRYLNECLTIRSKGSDPAKLVLPFQNVGYAYKLKENWKVAEKYGLLSLSLARRYKMGEEAARASLDLADVYKSQKRYKDAISSLDEVIGTAKTLKLPELLIRAYTTRMAIDVNMGDIESALYYTNLRNGLKDSVFTEAKNKYITEMETRYQTRQREQDIRSLHLQNGLQRKIVSQQKRSIVMLAVFAALLSLSLFFAIRNYRQKTTANVQIKLLMKDLHHRVKNNLQILSGIFTMQMDNLTDEATKATLLESDTRLAAMNLIHNQLYLSEATMQVDLQAYLRNLMGYIKIAFGNNGITLHFDIQEIHLDADKAVAIGLIVNELATNSFKHAFKHGVGSISLALSKTGRSMIRLTLKDDGCGIAPDAPQKPVSFGLGLVQMMTGQLNATLVTRHDHGVCYQFDFEI